MPVELPVKEYRQLPPMTANRTHTASSIIDTLSTKFILYLAQPYLAGKNSNQALAKALEIYSRYGFSGTLDVLGEDARCVDDCQAYVATYQNLIDEVARASTHRKSDRDNLTISMKPSMFSALPPDANPENERHLEDAFERIRQVVDYALKRHIAITLEAEDSAWTNFHLNTYFALRESGYDNLGTVLQTRLYRTKDDLEKFRQGMRVRLVIGIYKEPADIAYEDKAKMKDLLVEYAAQLLKRGVYVELATHDSQCIEKFIAQVVLPQKVPTNQFEFQFLLGVPRLRLEKALITGGYFRSFTGTFDQDGEAHLNALSESGALVRLYLPFGQDMVAAPYCKRRLKNNPNMIAYGIKNLLRIQS